MAETKEFTLEIERCTEAIACECGGYAARADNTKDECRHYGCGRDYPGHECCARAFVCRICRQRWVGSAPAPEME